jgi:hypothetical protein
VQGGLTFPPARSCRRRRRQRASVRRRRGADANLRADAAPGPGSTSHADATSEVTRWETTVAQTGVKARGARASGEGRSDGGRVRQESSDLQADRGMARPGLEPGTPRFSAVAPQVPPTSCGGLGLRLGLRAQSWRVTAQIVCDSSVAEGANLQALSTMARPGLEPGTPRFSGSRGRTIPLPEDLQIRDSNPPRYDAMALHAVGSAGVWDSAGVLKSQMNQRPCDRLDPSHALPSVSELKRWDAFRTGTSAR